MIGSGRRRGPRRLILPRRVTMDLVKPSDLNHITTTGNTTSFTHAGAYLLYEDPHSKEYPLAAFWSDPAIKPHHGLSTVVYWPLRGKEDLAILLASKGNPVIGILIGGTIVDIEDADKAILEGGLKLLRKGTF
jgi:hypothetical protein